MILTLFIVGSPLIFHPLCRYQSPQKCPFSRYLALMISNGLHSSCWYVTRMKIRLQLNTVTANDLIPIRSLCETVFVKNCVTAQYLRFLFAEHHISMICGRLMTYYFFFSSKKFKTDFVKCNSHGRVERVGHYLQPLYLSFFTYPQL